jgi:hypothetical protein
VLPHPIAESRRARFASAMAATRERIMGMSLKILLNRI